MGKRIIAAGLLLVFLLTIFVKYFWKSDMINKKNKIIYLTCLIISIILMVNRTSALNPCTITLPRFYRFTDSLSYFFFFDPDNISCYNTENNDSGIKNKIRK